MFATNCLWPSTKMSLGVDAVKRDQEILRVRADPSKAHDSLDQHSWLTTSLSLVGSLGA